VYTWQWLSMFSTSLRQSLSQPQCATTPWAVPIYTARWIEAHGIKQLAESCRAAAVYRGSSNTWVWCPTTAPPHHPNNMDISTYKKHKGKQCNVCVAPAVCKSHSLQVANAQRGAWRGLRLDRHGNDNKCQPYEHHRRYKMQAGMKLQFTRTAVKKN